MTLPDFRPIIERLEAADVEYILIGGLAMSAHGSAYVTRDIDVVYERSKANTARLTAALSGLHPRLRGFPPDLPFQWDEHAVRAAANITLDTDEASVDLLGDPPGVDSYNGLRERSVEKELYGVKVRVACIDDLIAMKRAANRLKDRSHVLELLALKKLIAEDGSAG